MRACQINYNRESLSEIDFISIKFKNVRHHAACAPLKTKKIISTRKSSELNISKSLTFYFHIFLLCEFTFAKMGKKEAKIQKNQRCQNVTHTTHHTQRECSTHSSRSHASSNKYKIIFHTNVINGYDGNCIHFVIQFRIFTNQEKVLAWGLSVWNVIWFFKTCRMSGLDKETIRKIKTEAHFFVTFVKLNRSL